MVTILIDCLDRLFFETELKPEIIIISQVNPIRYYEILESVKITRKLFVVEEGSITGGVGSELITSVHERLNIPILSGRIGALPVPIPSVKSLEDQVLPSADRIIETVKMFLNK
jgi:pyruvate/2-oxoglutarate/acetoin dehydrogenase E1 component